MSDLLFWFVSIRHTEVTDYIAELDKYIDSSAGLLIAKEVAKNSHKTTNGEHIHVAADMSVELYNKFHDNIHKKKLKLVLKATNGVGKQVGRIKNVETQEGILTYMCKDKNIIYRNMDQTDIKRYIENSFPKTESWDQQIQDYLGLNHNMDVDTFNGDGNEYDIDQLDSLVIQFYLDFSKQQAVPTRNFIRKMVLRFMMYPTRGLQRAPFYQIKQLLI